MTPPDAAVAVGPTSTAKAPPTDATAGPHAGRVNARRYTFLGWLFLPMLFYLVPLLEGYAWNALGPSYLPHNVLNPPEEYRGRLPQTRITAETWGASVVVVPFHARMRHYLFAGELPLWNPYSGLGQPFAAQGEGSPYFPISIVRSLLPYSLANYVTVGFIYVSAVFTCLFLSRVGVSRSAAIFGGMVWPITGALSLHLGRPNFADQICMVPVLFWAVTAAVQCRTVGRYVVFAVVTCLHLLAGHIQIAMMSGLGAPLFGVWYAWLIRPSRTSWMRDAVLLLGVFGLGNALGAFSLFPMLEAMRTSFSKNVASIGFLVTLPDANIVGFVTPYLFGQPFYESWLSGPRGAAVDWDDLFAFSGFLPVALVVAGLPALVRRSSPERSLFLFFVVGFVMMLLRYLSAPPFAALNLLPILDRQTPKHANAVMVFFVVIAASLALDALTRAKPRPGWVAVAALLAFLVGVVLTVIGQFGGFGKIVAGEILAPALLMTLTVTILAILAIGLCLGRDVSRARAAVLLGGVALAELSLYVPLGNAEPRFLYARLGLVVLIAATGLLLAYSRPRLAVGLGVVVLAGYVALVPWPRSGLPRQFEAEQPPTFMRWLASTETADDRSFGILQDWSSLAPVQDISAVGPLAPAEFLEFVRLIADEPTALEYSKTTHFMLSGPWSYDLGLYTRARPIMDWAGVRYIVLNRQYFGGSARRDAVPLTEPPLALREVYEDRRASILMSTEARSRAELWSGYTVADDQAAVLAKLKRDPSTILGAPQVEANQLSGELPPPASQPTRTAIPIGSYRPNTVDLSFEASSGGLLVLKDVRSAGWSAALNGREVPIVRVNGLVRGVFLPGPGQYTLRFTYLPATFVSGVYLSLATAALLALLVAGAAVRRRSSQKSTRVKPSSSGHADPMLHHAS